MRLLALGLVACAHAPVKPSTCSPLTAEIRERATAAETFNLDGYHAAMARAGLTPVALPSRIFAGGGGSDEGNLEGFPAPGSLIEENGQQLVAGPFISVPNGQLAQPYFEFARNAAGEIVQLERVLEVQSSETAILCGCGPVGSGAAPHVEQVLYELPAGAKFAGTVTISYPVWRFDFSYSGTDERGERCEPPP